MAEKYTQAEVDALGKKGHAFGPDDDGHYSYPIDDAEDLDNAIHAVGRGNADHDAIRKYIIGRADAMGLSSKIPDNWNKDGSLKDDDSKGINDRLVQLAQVRGTYGTDRLVADKRLAPRSQFELREVQNGTGGTNLKFTGFASVTGDDASYEMEDWLGPWTESITPGAFQKTLGEGADVAFLVNHGGMTLARTKPGTLKLSEETNPWTSPVTGVTGLHSEAMLDPQNPQVQAIRSAIERGDLDEMSFAFRVMRQEWNSDWDRRYINEVSLDKGDVSLVNYGANPHTGGTVSLRQRLGVRGLGDQNARLAMVVRRMFTNLEVRQGKVLSSTNEAQLKEALAHLHSADDADIPGIVRALQDINSALDAGQGCLAAVLGTANPDGDPGDLQPTLEPPEQKAQLRPSPLPAIRLALTKAA